MPASTRGLLIAAVAFAALVLAAPLVALPFAERITRGGLGGLLALTVVALLLVVASAACLALFVRGQAQAMCPPADVPAGSGVSPELAALAAAFQFDLEDLAANRTGVLSPRQRANRRTHRSIMAFMAVLMLGVTYLGLGLLLFLTRDGGTADAANRTTVLMGVAIVTALVAGSMVHMWWRARDQIRGRLAQVSGEAGPAQRGGTSASASLSVMPVGSLEVPITTPAQSEALQPGRAYTVYYLAGPLPLIQSIDPGR